MCLLFIPSTDAWLWVWSPEFTRPVSRFRSNYPSKHEKPTQLEQTSNQSLGLNDQQEFHEYFEQTLSTRGTNLHNLMNRIFEAEQMQLLKCFGNDRDNTSHEWALVSELTWRLNHNDDRPTAEASPLLFIGFQTDPVKLSKWSLMAN